MELKAVPIATLALLVGLLAACGEAPDVTSRGTATEKPALATPTAAATAKPEATPTPTGTASPVAELDFAALEDRENPERLLRFYASAIQAGRWDAAAAAWSLDSEVTAETLSKLYGGKGSIKLAIGKGDSDGAAGSLFYEAPVTVQSRDGAEALRGTIVLRRVNDVPGASEAQLNWRIERSSLVTDR